MTLYLLKVHSQSFLSIPITQKCQILIIKLSKNSSQNTTNGILATMGVGLSKLHVSAFYRGHHQVTITNVKRYTNMLNVG